MESEDELDWTEVDVKLPAQVAAEKEAAEKVGDRPLSAPGPCQLCLRCTCHAQAGTKQFRAAQPEGLEGSSIHWDMCASSPSILTVF